MFYPLSATAPEVKKKRKRIRQRQTERMIVTVVETGGYTLRGEVVAREVGAGIMCHCFHGTILVK